MSDVLALVMNEKDNVAMVLENTPPHALVTLLFQGKTIGTVETLEAIENYHKISLTDLKEGQQVKKYGEVIGIATQEIKIGEYLHTHNVRSVKV